MSGRGGQTGSGGGEAEGAWRCVCVCGGKAERAWGSVGCLVSN